MKKVVISIVVILVFLIGTSVYINSQNVVEEGVVEEVNVRRDNITIELIADGNMTIPVYEQYFELEGYVDSINVEVGDLVNVGDLIANLKKDDLELDVRQKELMLESQKIEVNDTLKNNNYLMDSQKTKIRESEIQIMGLTEDIRIMETYPEIYPLQDLKDAKKDLEIAEKELDDLKSYLGVLSVNNVAQNSINVQKAEVDLSISINKLNKATLVSQFDGMIIELNAERNSHVNDNEAFVKIAQMNNPILKSYVSELDIYQVEIGQKVYVELESDIGIQHEGVVKFINPIPLIDSNGIVSYEVEILMIEKVTGMMDGMTALVKYVLKERINVLMIPNNTVHVINGEQWVNLKKDSGIEPVKIITGLTDGLQVEVIEGLHEKDVLIVESK